MALLTILAAAQGGDYFAKVAKACGVSADDAKSNLENLCPAIAAQLKSEAQNDHGAFERLLDLLDEGGDSSDLGDPEAAQTAELFQLFWHPSAQNHTAQERYHFPRGYFWPNPWNAERLTCLIACAGKRCELRDQLLCGARGRRGGVWAKHSRANSRD